MNRARATSPPRDWRGVWSGLALLVGASLILPATFAHAAPRDAWGRPTTGGSGSAPSGAIKSSSSFPAPSPVTELNTPGAEAYPWISPDGRTIVYSSDRAGGLGLSDLYQATRPSRTGKFGPPVNLGGGVNGPRHDLQASLTADGLDIFFVRTDPVFDQWNANDLYHASRLSTSDPFGPATPIAELNTAVADAYPFITADGLTLYFTSDRSGSVGNDIWVATRNTRQSPFNAPTLVVELDTSDDEISFALRHDGLAGYFCRAASGDSNSEVFETLRARDTDPFCAPAFLSQLANPAFDCGPSPTADGRQLFFSSFQRPGGDGDFDLWRSTVRTAALPAVIDLNTTFGNEATPTQRIFGNDLSDELGGAGAAVVYGDFNGDGVADLLIGATGVGSQNGGAFILYGAPGQPVNPLNLKSPPGAFGETRIVGDDPLDVAGWSVAAGDVNGDGYDDVILGAPGGDTTAGGDAGEVYVIYGSSTLPGKTINLGLAPGANGELRILGGQAGARAGAAVACGDLNADGYADVVIGSPLADPAAGADAGEATIIFGGASLGAGIIDLSLPPGSAGETRVRGPAASAQAGFALACGDLDGDGYDDLAIGAPHEGSDRGAAYILYGGPAIGAALVDLSLAPSVAGTTRVVGAAAGDLLGYSLAAGDGDGDGFEDLLLGEPGLAANAGGGAILYGSPSLRGTTIDLALPPGAARQTRLAGASAGAMLGYSAACGDATGDGLADFLLGSVAASPGGGAMAGALTLYPGVLGGLPASPSAVTALGDNAGDQLGWGCAAGGDYNLDGVGDFTASAPHAANPSSGASFTDEGAAAQIFGRTTVDEAVALARHRAGAAPPRGMGGRLTPSVRCRVGYDAGSSVSLTTATLVRSSDGVVGLGSGDDLAAVLWHVESDRAGFAAASLGFRYLPTEIVGLLPSSLRLWSAPAIDGPWTEVATQNVDPSRDEIAATVPTLGWFALLGQPDPAYNAIRNIVFQGHTIPPSMYVGQELLVGVKFKNVGQAPLDGPLGQRLGARDQDCLFAPARIPLDDAAPIQPGDGFQAIVSLGAPPTPGVCHVTFQMIQDGVKWFGPQLTVAVNIIPRTNAVEAWTNYE